MDSVESLSSQSSDRNVDKVSSVINPLKNTLMPPKEVETPLSKDPVTQTQIKETIVGKIEEKLKLSPIKNDTSNTPVSFSSTSAVTIESVTAPNETSKRKPESISSATISLVNKIDEIKLPLTISLTNSSKSQLNSTPVTNSNKVDDTFIENCKYQSSQNNLNNVSLMKSSSNYPLPLSSPESKASKSLSSKSLPVKSNSNSSVPIRSSPKPCLTATAYPKTSLAEEISAANFSVNSKNLTLSIKSVETINKSISDKSCDERTKDSSISVSKVKEMKHNDSVQKSKSGNTSNSVLSKTEQSVQCLKIIDLSSDVDNSKATKKNPETQASTNVKHKPNNPHSVENLLKQSSKPQSCVSDDKSHKLEKEMDHVMNALLQISKKNQSPTREISVNELKDKSISISAHNRNSSNRDLSNSSGSQYNVDGKNHTTNSGMNKISPVDNEILNKTQTSSPNMKNTCITTTPSKNISSVVVNKNSRSNIQYSSPISKINEVYSPSSKAVNPNNQLPNTSVSHQSENSPSRTSPKNNTSISSKQFSTLQKLQQQQNQTKVSNSSTSPQISHKTHQALLQQDQTLSLMQNHSHFHQHQISQLLSSQAHNLSVSESSRQLSSKRQTSNQDLTYRQSKQPTTISKDRESLSSTWNKNESSPMRVSASYIVDGSRSIKSSKPNEITIGKFYINLNILLKSATNSIINT